MRDPIDRLYALKHEAAKHGLWMRQDQEGPLRVIAGRDFCADLLLHPRMRRSSMATLSGDLNTVFGIRFERNDRVHPDSLKLVFELDG